MRCSRLPPLVTTALCHPDETPPQNVGPPQPPRPRPPRPGPAPPSARGPARPDRLVHDRPAVRHRSDVPELVRVEHRADRLDLPAQYVERHGGEDLAVPVADDRARLAV